MSAETLNGYRAYYKNDVIEVYATSSYKAQQLAALKFKPKNNYEITIVVCEIGGNEVIHKADI